MLLFALVNLYTANLLAQCYRTGDPVTGKRNYTYMDAVKSTLGNTNLPINILTNKKIKLTSGLHMNKKWYFVTGGTKVKLCGLIQYVNLFGIAIGYTIAASVSMM